MNETSKHQAVMGSSARRLPRTPPPPQLSPPSRGSCRAGRRRPPPMQAQRLCWSAACSCAGTTGCSSASMGPSVHLCVRTNVAGGRQPPLQRAQRGGGGARWACRLRVCAHPNSTRLHDRVTCTGPAEMARRGERKCAPRLLDMPPTILCCIAERMESNDMWIPADLFPAPRRRRRAAPVGSSPLPDAPRARCQPAALPTTAACAGCAWPAPAGRCGRLPARGLATACST